MVSYSRWSLVACLVGTFLLRTAASIMGSTIQLYLGYIDQNIYRLSDTARGVTLAVFFLPELVGSPLLGAWSDRLGRKWFMVLGAVFGGIGVQLTAMTTDLSTLILMRLLGGLSTASAVPATLGYLSAVTAHSESLRGRVMGLFEIASVGGTIAGILFGGRLWDLFHQGAFTIDAFVYVASLVLFLAIRRQRHRTTQYLNLRTTFSQGWTALSDALSYYRTVFTSPAVLRFAPAFLAISAVLGIWLNHIVGQLVATDRAFPDQTLYGLLANAGNAGTDISIYGTIVLGIFGLGALGWSVLLGRFRRTVVMLINVAALFLLCALVFEINHSSNLQALHVILLAVLAGLALLVLSGMMPAALTYLADVTEERQHDRGAIMGLYTILFGLGGFLGTLIGGPFADWKAIDGILIATVCLGIVAAILLVRLYQTEMRHELKTTAILSKE